MPQTRLKPHSTPPQMFSEYFETRIQNPVTYNILPNTLQKVTVVHHTIGLVILCFSLLLLWFNTITSYMYSLGLFGCVWVLFGFIILNLYPITSLLYTTISLYTGIQLYSEVKISPQSLLLDCRRNSLLALLMAKALQSDYCLQKKKWKKL